MVFTSDFNLQSFGNVLSLTKPLLSVDEVVAGFETKDVVTKSLNTSSLNVDGFTTLDVVTISLGLNSTNNNLFNINSSGTANISQGNFSTINASNIVGYQETLIAGDNINIVGNTISTSADANFSSVNADFINSSNVVNVSEIVGADCDFGSGYIQSFKSELINASNMNLSNELNASTIQTIGRVDIGNANGQSKGLVLTGTEPTITFKETSANQRSGMIHMNDSRMYFLSGVSNSEAWTQVNGQWPLILNTSTNVAQFGGNIISPNWKVIKPVFNLNNRFPDGGGATQVTVATNVVITGNFILHFYNSAYKKNSTGLGIFQLYAVPNAGGTNIMIGDLRQYFNSVNFHLSFSQSNYVTNVPAGTYSLLLTRNNTSIIHDVNDWLTIIMEMIPF
jgi:hypothetical protein